MEAYTVGFEELRVLRYEFGLSLQFHLHANLQ